MTSKRERQRENKVADRSHRRNVTQWLTGLLSRLGSVTGFESSVQTESLMSNTWIEQVVHSVRVEVIME